MADIDTEFRQEELRDSLCSFQDLRERNSGTWGCAVNRFREDPLKIMCLVRVAVQYGLPIDRETWLAAAAYAPRSGEVAAERLTEEFGKVLVLDEVDMALDLLDDLGFFQVWLPELSRLKGLVQNRYHTKDVWEHTRLVVKNTKPSLILRLAALVHDLGKWETASRECYVRGTILRTEQDYKVEGFTLQGKNLAKWVDKEAEVRGGRLDNYPERIMVKSTKQAQGPFAKCLEMAPEGKRQFLNHEKESARLVKEILPRFRWHLFLPGGNLGEQELIYIVSRHMAGTLTFMDEFKENVNMNRANLRRKSRRFAWAIGWNGREYNGQRLENLLDLWRADFLGGKRDAAENISRLDEIQGEIRKAAVFLKERAGLLDWTPFEEFARSKSLTGNPYERLQEQVRSRVMLEEKNSLADRQFLEREYWAMKNSVRKGSGN